MDIREIVPSEEYKIEDEYVNLDKKLLASVKKHTVNE